MKYFLAKDDDCHWYLVEADKRGQWNSWLEAGYEDVPSFARELQGHVSNIEFENPIEV